MLDSPMLSCWQKLTNTFQHLSNNFVLITKPGRGEICACAEEHRKANNSRRSSSRTESDCQEPPPIRTGGSFSVTRDFKSQETSQ
ncbi:unnamed protein product [Ectocarpus sp. CCAP 1310/34]|nr:unnamed protein product [Ectocarpus sp. CCAP 1310/34]